MIKKLDRIEIVSDREIKLFYQNGEIRLFDITPYLKGDFMGRMADPAYFRMAAIEPKTGDTLCWPEGQDIAPHELYDFSRKV
ncbi:DUF2442 domain-containing protein [uncultured Dialister sp.]|jgi:hypothetical protein|uniref:DUF2442 domain-containing protein n=1 Tax=uncultured Dialister sp. TaxID=278064 RepID=UPI002628F565|nr:DUF2442 domain-containing protein [uncultured Dialister sp.]